MQKENATIFYDTPPDKIQRNSIIRACLEDVLPRIASQSIDMICIDPPYLTTDLQFDKDGINLPLLKKEFARILKPSGYLVSFGSIELLAAFCDPFAIRFSGMWLKQCPVMRTATAKKPMSKCEPYAVYALKGAKIKELVYNPQEIAGGKPYRKVRKNIGYLRGGKDSLSRANRDGWTKDGYISESRGFIWQTDVLEAPNKTGMRHKERTLHPTQKPVSALRTLVRMLTNEGDLVLDCFAGSGSTGEACAWEKRDFILIEKSEEYYERDIKGRFVRLEEELQQGEILPKKNNAAIAQARITHAQKEKAADAASAQTNLF